jgi:hypothetical protein
MKSYHDYGTFTPIQVASIIALEGPQDCVETVRQVYQKRRDVTCARGLKAVGWKVEMPKATMYIWAKIPGGVRRMGSLEFSKKLLHRRKVAVVARHRLREYGDDHVRFALIENEARTRQAMRGIRDMLRKDAGVPLCRASFISIDGAVLLMNPINVGLLGIGTVGGGTFHRAAAQPGRDRSPRGRAITTHGGRQGSRRSAPGRRRAGDGDAFEVVNDPEIDIVVELIGGTASRGNWC